MLRLITIFKFQISLLCLGLFLFWLPQPVPQKSPNDSGAKLFQAHCAACHGQKGEGGTGPTLATPKLIRADSEASLFKIIREGIAGTEMPGTRVEAEQLKNLAAYVRSLGQLQNEKNIGDAERGKKLYFSKGECASCHAINGEGSAYAPDLSEIGLRRGRQHLMTSLLAPQADVPKSYLQLRAGTAITDNFLLVRVVTKDGKKISGVRVNEDTFTIHLREISGRVHSFFKSELLELHKDWGKSSMPSYRKILEHDELIDVVAYLVSLRGEK